MSLDGAFTDAAAKADEKKAREARCSGPSDVRVMKECNEQLVSKLLEAKNGELDGVNEKLRSANVLLGHLFDHGPAVIYSLRAIAGRLDVSFVSENIVKLLGFTAAECSLKTWWKDQLHPEDFQLAMSSVPRVLKEGRSHSEYRLRHKDGHYVWIEDRSRRVPSNTGQPTSFVGVWIDIMERKNAEESSKLSQRKAELALENLKCEIAQREELEGQHRQSQKMEAIGQLAGGIAHDFNNILAVILMHSDSLLERHPQGASAEDIEGIKLSAERAAALTRQLLVFSRKKLLDPKVIDLNRSIGELEKMLHRLIGEDIHLVTKFDPALRQVRVDPSQFEQVVMNLTVNARDAMPKGGTLTLETANVELDDTHVLRNFGVKPGRYAMLKSSDTGCGMNAATVARIFEPFFTTKAEGVGTGLGLSTVFGIVKQAEGDISVYSEPGKGSVFKVYFPEYNGVAKVGVKTPENQAALQGTETILVVEDEPELRRITSKVLRQCGYTVLEAKDGLQALSIFDANVGVIDLVMTDVIMPSLSGPEFVQRLTTAGKNPDLKVLFLSGYSAGKLHDSGLSDESVHFLEKPYTRRILLKKLRAVFAEEMPKRV